MQIVLMDAQLSTTSEQDTKWCAHRFIKPDDAQHDSNVQYVFYWTFIVWNIEMLQEL